MWNNLTKQILKNNLKNHVLATMIVVLKCIKLKSDRFIRVYCISNQLKLSVLLEYNEDSDTYSRKVCKLLCQMHSLY